MPFQIIRNDITKVKADAIVNTANPKPCYGSGVDSAIYKAAGEKKLLAERKKIGDIAPGTVAVTPAFKLDAKYIIHTVGPVWEDGKHGEFDVLKACYEKSLKKAYSLKCKSIAFPLIATGVYGFPKDKGLEIAMDVLREFASHHRMEIYLVIFDAKSYELSGNVFKDIQAYIDDNYVENATSEYYETSEEGRLEELREARLRRRELLEREHLVRNTPTEPDGEDAIFASEIVPSKNLVDFKIADEDKTFQEKLFEYIDKSGMTDPEFYKPIEMSRQTFAKIRKNNMYQPSRANAFRFCIRLKLDITEATDLLSRAGYTFNPSKKFDMVIKACIINKQYDINMIELILEKNGFKESFLKYE